MIRKLRMLAWLTVLFALFLWVSPANAVEYGLKIAGVSVTDKNCKDLSKIAEGIKVAEGGYFKYDPDMKTLSMKGVEVPESSGIGDPIIDNENIDGLIINISGDIEVQLDDLVMLFKKSTIIQGDGTLDLNTYGAKVISVQSEATLTISNTTLYVEAQGGEGIMGTTNKEELIIDNAKVWSKAIANFAKCTFNNCRIVKPEGATWDNSKHMIVDKNHQMADYVEIQPNDYLGLFIANVAVTDKNCKDLSKIAEGIKVAEGGYFKYDPTAKTLSMKGVTIDCDKTPIWNQRVENLIIDVSGENKLKGSGFWYTRGIFLDKNTTLQGDGKLLVECSKNNGIELNSKVTLTISNITLEVEGKQRGISGQGGTFHETLIINNAVVSAKGAEAAIGGLAEFTPTGCYIISPAGGNFDATKYVVVDADGNKAKEVKIVPIIEYGLNIAKVKVTNANSNDLSGITGVTVLEGGHFKYDPAMKTLSMKGVTIESTALAIHNESIKELIIKVSGENKLKMTNTTGITVSESTTIQGDGKLIIESKSSAGCYIFPKVSLTISEITLETSGDYGIAGADGKQEETLIIKHAAVTAKGSKFAIGDLAKLTLSDCRIDLPKKAQLNDTQHVVLDEKGDIAKEVKILRTNVAPTPPTPNAVEDTLLSSIIVAPNPFSSQLRINHKEVVNARYELLDTNGSILYQGALEGTETILNSENLKAGVYLLRILSGDVVKTLRVVRE